MAEPLNRDEVIGLLDDLGSERDETVLAAARTVHAKVAAANLTWQDLLRPQDDGTAGETGPEADSEDGPRDDADHEDEVDPGVVPGAEPGADPGADPEADPGADPGQAEAVEAEAASDNDAESLALIEALLAKKGISAELRRELQDYKSDIAEGAFDQGDRKYLRAMHKRLMKGS